MYHEGMSARAKAASELIAELGRKYIWWTPTGGSPFAEERVIAQVMNIGTYADIRRLESIVEPGRLAEVMLRAEPGWFSRRSWEFWRGRLAGSVSTAIDAEPPRRYFDAVRS